MGIVGLIFFCVFLLIIILGISLIIMDIDLYYLSFKIEKHPVLVAMVDDVIAKILKDEDIRMFHVSYDKLNATINDESKKAIGMYVYTLDAEQHRNAKNALIEIEKLENEYKIPYKEICKLSGIESNIEKENFILPKILLCEDKLMKYGLGSYYGTYFHEIGHHFAAKELGNHTEDDANKYGRKLILENLPFFFQLFSDFSFKYRLDLPKLSLKESLRANFDYLKYYIHNRKTIIKTKKNEKRTR